MEDNVPFFDMMSDPVPLFAQETRLGACASSLISLDISSSVSLFLLRIKMRNKTRAIRPTTDPTVAPAMTHALLGAETSKLI